MSATYVLLLPLFHLQFECRSDALFVIEIIQVAHAIFKFKIDEKVDSANDDCRNVDIQISERETMPKYANFSKRDYI